MEKIQNFVNSICEEAEKDGYSAFSTCNYSNWDKDIWNFRHQIIDVVRSRGYLVSSVVRHGVTDVTITKKLNIS